MKKLLVAMFVIEQKEGSRVYGLMTREGMKVKKITVADCGHGAALAHELARKEYQISQADWAYQLARKYGV